MKDQFPPDDPTERAKELDRIILDAKREKKALALQKKRTRKSKTRPFGAPKHRGQPAEIFDRDLCLWSLVWVQAIIAAEMKGQAGLCNKRPRANISKAFEPSRIARYTNVR